MTCSSNFLHNSSQTLNLYFSYYPKIKIKKRQRGKREELDLHAAAEWGSPDVVASRINHNHSGQRRHRAIYRGRLGRLHGKAPTLELVVHLRVVVAFAASPSTTYQVAVVDGLCRRHHLP